MLTNPTRNSRFPFKAALRESPTTYLAHKVTRTRRRCRRRRRRRRTHDATSSTIKSGSKRTAPSSHSKTAATVTTTTTTTAAVALSRATVPRPRRRAPHAQAPRGVKHRGDGRVERGRERRGPVRRRRLPGGLVAVRLDGLLHVPRLLARAAHAGFLAGATLRTAPATTRPPLTHTDRHTQTNNHTHTHPPATHTLPSRFSHGERRIPPPFLSSFHPLLHFFSHVRAELSASRSRGQRRRRCRARRPPLWRHASRLRWSMKRGDHPCEKKEPTTPPPLFDHDHRRPSSSTIS